MLARNEQRRLARALESVPAGASLLVLDAESTDRTVEIGREHGATVLSRPWSGFVTARRFALGAVATPWTFMLDADEMLDAALRASIARAEPGECGGFYVRRRTWLCGRAMRSAPWGDERLLRLFRTHAARLVAAPVTGGDAELHESWHVDGDTATLDGRLEHDSYPTLASYFRKFDRYTTLEARAQKPRPSLALKTLAFAPLRAAWLFAGRGGYRDGWRGAFVALFSALYPVVSTLKALVR